MKIVIVGVGRVGARLAQTLQDRHEVTVIDQDEHAFRRLGTGFRGLTVKGNGIDVDVLKAAGTASADVLIAVTNGDNRNLTAAQVAKSILGVNRVIARVYDPVRSEIYREIGLETICPTVDGAHKLFNQVVGV